MRAPRRGVLFVGILAILMLSPVVGAADAANSRAVGERPNIVYIMIDELGYFELSCMGNDKLQTPCIDRMAEVLERYCLGTFPLR